MGYKKCIKILKEIKFGKTYKDLKENIDKEIDKWNNEQDELI